MICWKKPKPRLSEFARSRQKTISRESKNNEPFNLRVVSEHKGKAQVKTKRKYAAGEKCWTGSTLIYQTRSSTLAILDWGKRRLWVMKETSLITNESVFVVQTAKIKATFSFWLSSPRKIA